MNMKLINNKICKANNRLKEIQNTKKIHVTYVKII